jgi:alpha-galactosidase
VRLDFPDESLAAHGVVARDQAAALYSFASVSRSDVVFLGRLTFPGLNPERHYRIRPLLVGSPPSGLHPPAWWGPPGAEPAGVVQTGAALSSTGLMAAGINPEQAVLYLAEAVD